MKKKLLDIELPNESHSPYIYDVPVFINWFIEGVKEIEIKDEKNYRALLYFASVNGLLSIDSNGFAYVVGMRLNLLK